MKNSKLKGMLKSASLTENSDFEVLNPSEEGELKGGLACFTCGNFRCRGGFAPAEESIDALQ